MHCLQEFLPLVLLRLWLISSWKSRTVSPGHLDDILPSAEVSKNVKCSVLCKFFLWWKQFFSAFHIVINKCKWFMLPWVWTEAGLTAKLQSVWFWYLCMWQNTTHHLGRCSGTAGIPGGVRLTLSMLLLWTRLELLIRLVYKVTVPLLTHTCSIYSMSSTQLLSHLMSHNHPLRMCNFVLLPY